MKKQIISIILLFLLIAPAVVTYTWIQQRKRAVKKEVKWKMIAGIDKKELVLLKFSKTETTTELKWKHSKEFEFNNQMYDIVDKITTKDSVKYWCWWDFEETKLNQQLSKLLVNVYQNDIPTKEKQSQIIQFYKSLFFEQVVAWQPFLAIRSFYNNSCINNFYHYLFIKLDTPPPNSFS
jgi:hypothetical protein